ncbi:protein giant-lens-like [Tropilaelaps mercedesae]|uniref:Protein giant-lens-like n=1 Tax=Tropilaelaps mercedesae TaxID=418985 RepID=A0A1V9Y3Q3_9ACAR|nr:protein giant-lens-like [Tropilaelaps mercedesae]
MELVAFSKLSHTGRADILLCLVVEHPVSPAKQPVLLILGFFVEAWYLFRRDNCFSSESDLPECAPRQVCNRVDIYATPWVERQCRCPPGSGFNKQQLCPQTVDTEDGFSLSDRTRLFKTCEPVNVLPTCRYFRDITWTIKQTGVTSVSGATSSAGGSSSAMGRQTVNCVCPRNSVAYIARHEAIQDRDGTIQGFKYSFACSPQTRQTCGPSAPCRLFTVKRRRFVDEVNTNTLCECETGRRCPSQHTDESITPGSFFKEDHVKVFTGFCQPAKNISVSPVAWHS